MIRRFGSLFLMALVLMGLAPIAFANMPILNNTFNLEVPQFGGDQPSGKFTLEVVRNPNFTSGILVLPKEMFDVLKKGNAQSPASTLPGGVLALAFTGSLVAGGLWLARVPRAKFLVAIMIPLLGLAFLGSALHAQPARLESPRAVLETAKMTIIRGEAEHVQLILPKR